MPDLPSSVRDFLDRHPWLTTMPRLVVYARRKAAALVWSGVRRGPMAGGRGPEDVVHTAIMKVLTGARIWDPVTQPDLAAFLETVIDSEMSHLVESWEHRHVRPVAALYADEDNATVDLLAATASPDAGPLDAAIAREEDAAREDFYGMFFASLDDDQVLQRIVACIHDDVVKPGEIAARLGIQATEVYNRRKQLQRRLTVFYERWNATRPADEQGPGRKSWRMPD